MAEEDAPEDSPKDPDGPSLELPSFGFRRKKRAAQERPASAEAPPPAPASPLDPEPVAAPVSQPAAEPPRADPPLFVSEAPTDPPEEAAPARRARRRPALPRLGAVPAALTTGLVIGLLTVGLVWVSQAGCELVRGTSTCGDAGFLLLLAVLVVAGWLGGVLLRAFGLPEGGSTSFLAMGLVAVGLLLFLADQLFAWWMVIAVPVLAMGGYVLAHRVTTAMVEPGGREMHR